MNRWQLTPLPILQGGEDTASASLVGDRPGRIENGLITGAGVVEQQPDWRVADTCKNTTPVENHAVCGIFPFATQGGAASASAGVAFSFNTADNAIYLHQLSEDNAILRSFTAYAGYVEAAPPQMTGFEMFGKFYFCQDGRQAAAARLGLAVFDPTGAGAVAHPTYDLGGGAGLLRFRGTAKHRGATILGIGYDSNTTPDAPHMLRYSKYLFPDTWVPDTTETTAGAIAVGTLNLPLVACAQSGQYSVVAKESEIFVLDGDYSAQFYLRSIGAAHGPTSVTGMTSNGPMAAWMAQSGPAISVNGGQVQRIGVGRLTRRLATYYDLTYAWAVSDSARTRFGWLLRRRSALDGTPRTAFWADEVLWWDYQRDDFHISGTPTTCFSIGITNGPGTVLAGPSGTPTPTAASVTSSSATLPWTHAGGDTSASISVEYKLASAGTYTVVGPAAAGALSWLLSGLTVSTAYNWRLRYYKNGQYGAYTAVQNFTTSAASAVGQPTNFVWDPSGPNEAWYGGKLYLTFDLSWTRGEFAVGSQTQVWERATTGVFAGATLLTTLPSATVGYSRTRVQNSTLYYYWVRHILADGTAGTETALTNQPLSYA